MDEIIESIWEDDGPADKEPWRAGVAAASGRVPGREERPGHAGDAASVAAGKQPREEPVQGAPACDGQACDGPMCGAPACDEAVERTAAPCGEEGPRPAVDQGGPRDSSAPSDRGVPGPAASGTPGPAAVGDEELGPVAGPMPPAEREEEMRRRKRASAKPQPAYKKVRLGHPAHGRAVTCHGVFGRGTGPSKKPANDVLDDERGQGTTEYAILVGVLVLIAIVAIVAFRGRVQELWTSIADGINSL